MKSAAGILALFIGVAAADVCYMQLQQQFNGGIGGSAGAITVSVKRGDCPKNVDEPNTDNCEELAREDLQGGAMKVDAGLDWPIGVTSDNSLKDGFMDYGDQHHDFNDDDDACEYSHNDAFSASINEQVCSFEC